MNDGFILSVIFVAAVAVILILLIIFRSFFFSFHETTDLQDIIIDAAPAKERIPCILCGAKLVKGENLISEEYKGEKESLVYVKGCPYCTGKKDRRAKTCPVCHTAMDASAYLVGRMWDTKKGKKHLHVSGCVSCSRILKRS